MVIKLMTWLIGEGNVNARNLSGLTAMDIFNRQRDSLAGRVGEILRDAKAKSASELDGSTMTLADYLSRNLSLFEKRDKRLGIIGQSQEKSIDLRNVVLVVAVLIATATYQAALSPPGGYWQDDSPPGNNPATNTTIINSRAGKMILRGYNLFLFFFLNSVAFYTSLATILIVISGLPYFGALLVSISFLIYAYYSAIISTFPISESLGYRRATLAYVIIMYVISVSAAVIPAIASSKYKKLKRQVDTIKRHMG